jgi:hypothetical protein
LLPKLKGALLNRLFQTAYDVLCSPLPGGDLEYFNPPAERAAIKPLTQELLAEMLVRSGKTLNDAGRDPCRPLKMTATMKRRAPKKRSNKLTPLRSA